MNSQRDMTPLFHPLGWLFGGGEKSRIKKRIGTWDLAIEKIEKAIAVGEGPGIGGAIQTALELMEEESYVSDPQIRSRLRRFAEQLHSLSQTEIALTVALRAAKPQRNCARRFLSSKPASGPPTQRRGTA